MLTRRALLGAGAGLGIAALLPIGRSLAATDQLRLALPQEPDGLDPTIDANISTQAIAHENLFEGLTSLDENGNIEPGLAASWSTSPDGLTYSFRLQPEVRYHDGTEFDADHVVFSFNRLRAADSAAPNKALYTAIKQIVARDTATVEILLGRPDDTLLFNLARSDAAIVAPESAGNNRNVPIGTGPFVYLQWDRGQDIVLQRNEDYWGVHPRISQATFLFVSDSAAAVAALLAGQLDGLPFVTNPTVLGAAKQNPAIQLLTGVGPDRRPRLGAWNSKLTGMWRNAPLEGCVLAGVRWADDNGTPQSGPATLPSGTVDD